MMAEAEVCVLLCCLLAGNLSTASALPPQHSSMQDQFWSPMKGDFSALLLSLPEAAKQDLQLVFLLFNLPKLFWAWDPCLALPRDNLCQHLCTDLGTAAAWSKVRGLGFARPTLPFERQVCQTGCSRHWTDGKRKVHAVCSNVCH